MYTVFTYHLHVLIYAYIVIQLMLQFRNKTILFYKVYVYDVCGKRFRHYGSVMQWRQAKVMFVMSVERGLY